VGQDPVREIVALLLGAAGDHGDDDARRGRRVPEPVQRGHAEVGADHRPRDPPARREQHSAQESGPPAPSKASSISPTHAFGNSRLGSNHVSSAAAASSPSTPATKNAAASRSGESTVSRSWPTNQKIAVTGTRKLPSSTTEGKWSGVIRHG